MSSKLALAALEARKHWLTVEWLRKYAPELNDIEVVWHDLKAHNLAHYTFTDAADLDRAIHQAVQALNNERSRNPLVNWRIFLGSLLRFFGGRAENMAIGAVEDGVRRRSPFGLGR